MKKIAVIICFCLIAGSLYAQKRDKNVVKKEIQWAGKFVEIPAQHYVNIFKDTAGNQISRKEITVGSFYMMETEVTNKMYKTFLQDLKNQGRLADFEKAKIHDECWESYDYNKNFHYSEIPFFDNYPVVNISHEGALLFCQWLTEKVGCDQWTYSLPSEQQWASAARGFDPTASYSWKEGFYGESYKKHCCLWEVTQSNISRDGKSFKFVGYSDIAYRVRDSLKVKGWPMPAKILLPNDYGLYNTCGNVAELVDSGNVAMGGSWYDAGYDVRVTSRKEYSGPSPMIGFRVIAIPQKTTTVIIPKNQK